MNVFTLQQHDGADLQLESKPSRIVSLVPSVTENLMLFGLTPIARTSFCIEPQGDVDAIPVVGGTKTPNLSKIISLHPDLVIANKEENMREHVEALENQGVPVWTTYPVTLQDTVNLMKDLERLCGTSAYSRTIISDACAELSASDRQDGAEFTFATMIWKDPWMAVGSNTYINSLLEYIGGRNVFSDMDGRYQEIDLQRLTEKSPDLVMLPSEPYAFDQTHANEIKSILPDCFVALFCGEDLCWPGPRMLQTLNELKKIKQEFL